MYDNILGQRLKQLRIEAGLTQAKFGENFNLAKSTVSQYESGKSRPDDELKKKIADFYQVSLDWLMGRIDADQSLGIQYFRESKGNYDILKGMEPETRKLVEQIQGLSTESKEELKRYIELLKIKECYDKNQRK